LQLSNSTILNGSAAYTRIGQITANDVDSDNTKLEYSLSGVDKEYFLCSSSTYEKHVSEHC
jgi:YHS domain-containing protein